MMYGNPCFRNQGSGSAQGWHGKKCSVKYVIIKNKHSENDLI